MKISISKSVPATAKKICIYQPHGSESDLWLCTKTKISVKHFRPTANGIELYLPDSEKIWIYAPSPVIYLVLADEIINSDQVRGIIVDHKRQVGRLQLWLLRVILLKEKWLLGSDVGSPTLRRQRRYDIISHHGVTIADWLNVLTKVTKLQMVNAKPIVECQVFINGLATNQ